MGLRRAAPLVVLAAKKCILDLAKTWKLAGAGKAMVLLSFEN